MSCRITNLTGMCVVFFCLIYIDILKPEGPPVGLMVTASPSESEDSGSKPGRVIPKWYLLLLPIDAQLLKIMLRDT